MMVEELPIDALVPLGLGLVGWDVNRSQRANINTNMERWKAAYVPTPQVCNQCFKDLQTAKIAAARIDSHNINVAGFLMTLNWMSNYPTLPMIAKDWKKSEKTCCQQM